MRRFERKQNVFTNKDALGESYKPERIEERDDEISEYMDALQPVVDGWEPDNVFVYGKTGVGKTAVTRYMMDALEYEARDRDGVDTVASVEVNCHHHPSSYQAAIALVNELRADTDRDPLTTGLSTSDVLNALFDEIEAREGTVLIVLDEIDNLGDDDEWRAFRTDEHLLVMDRDGEETHFYNTADDPYQAHNLTDLVHDKQDLQRYLVDAAKEYDDRYFLNRIGERAN